MLEKTPESPLDCKEIQPVHPKGDQSWVFIGRTDAEAETPVLWPPHGKSWLSGKDPDAGRDWGQEEKGTTRWDGWMASPTRWTWAWVNSGSWWWTGRSGMLGFMGSQGVGHDWVTELNWTYIHSMKKYLEYGLIHKQWFSRKQNKTLYTKQTVLPLWLTGKESTSQRRWHVLDPWSGKIPQMPSN